MSAIISFSICLDDIDKGKVVTANNGKRYLNLTASVNEETRYGNNVGISHSQTKEEREAKEAKKYLGNGRVVWTDGGISVAERDQEKVSLPDSDLGGSNDLEF